MPTHPLVGKIAAVRSELGRLRRKLPPGPGGPGVPREDMAAAYHLEQAIRQCKRAEEAWDDARPEADA